MKQLGRTGVRKVSPRKGTVWGPELLDSQVIHPPGRTRENPAPLAGGDFLTQRFFYVLNRSCCL